MKKFFSLVLALVMALSLTTVAWGVAVADGPALQAAVDDGETTITLPAGDFAEGSADGLFLSAVTAGSTITIEGNGTTVNPSTVWGQKVGFMISYANGITLKFKNITFTGAGRGIEFANSSNVTLVVEDCVFNTTSTGVYLSAAIADATFVNCVFDGCAAGIGTEGVGDLMVDDCVFEDTCGEAIGWTGTGDMSVENSTVESAIKNYSAPNTDDVSFEGSTFTVLPDAVFLDGSDVIQNINGEFAVVPADAAGNKGTLYTADGLKTKITEAADFVYVPAKALSKSVLTGNVAYYTSATAGAGNVWMVVGATDALNTDSILKIGGTEKYVRAVDADDVYYVATATAYTNIGEKCGQIVDDGFGTKYYTLKDNEGKAIDGYFVEGTQGNVLLGTAVVGMAAADPAIVAHEWEEAGFDKDGYCNALKCANCPATAKLYKPGTVPAGLKSEASYYPVYELMVVNAPAASTDKTVESAKTFDAGIAMYVGMSVMAAAGSAVVLKKKD